LKHDARGAIVRALFGILVREDEAPLKRDVHGARQVRQGLHPRPRGRGPIEAPGRGLSGSAPRRRRILVREDEAPLKRCGDGLAPRTGGERILVREDEAPLKLSQDASVGRADPAASSSARTRPH